MPKTAPLDHPHVHHFDTAAPVDASVDIEVGVVRATASDRADTVVTVLPGPDGRAADVKAAEQTRVDFSDGTLRVRGPKSRSLFGRSPSIVVEVELPAGSRLEGRTAVADVECRGRFAGVRVKAAVGDVRVGRADFVQLHSGYGSITADHIEGSAEITTGSGEIRLGTVTGNGDIKNSNGDTRVDDITGTLDLRIANGHVAVGRARSSVTSRTANGDIRLDEVVRGKVTVETAAGDIEIGIREGSAAWLDVNSTVGRVQMDLEDSAGPGDAEETVEVRARTTIGNVTVRRAGSPPGRG